MNRWIKLPLASAASMLALALFAAPAHADEPAAPAAPAVPAANVDHPAAAPVTKPFKSFALEANPLAATLGRYSIQGEWLPTEHHAIVLNPYFNHASSDGPNSLYTESFTGFGAELGYRYYTGSSGANGFFIGPSVIAATYSSSTSGAIVNGGGDVSFTSIGGAVDFGGQWIIDPGVVVGFGAGLQ
jgi:hypothetical protein